MRKDGKSIKGLCNGLTYIKMKATLKAKGYTLEKLKNLSIRLEWHIAKYTHANKSLTIPAIAY